MARVKFNHNRNIKDYQPAPIKSLYAGTIVQFDYSGDKIYDKTPIVLVLWNDYKNYKVHGINLNYLSNFKMRSLFNKLMDRGNVILEEDQDAVGDYDDNLPYRNLLTDPYTRIKLPTYRENRGGNPLSKSEAIKQMNGLYEKVLKKVVVKSDTYRTYHSKKMKTIRVVTLDMGRILK